MDERQVLRAAAEYISEHGWYQGDSFASPYADADNETVLADRPPACALGAIAIGTGRYMEWQEPQSMVARRLLKEHLNSTGDADIGLIQHWNDAPERTAEDVILALKQAAEL